MYSTRVKVLLNISCLLDLARTSSRPSVGGVVRRAPGERGKNERVWEGRTRIPLAPALLPTRLLFWLAVVFVHYHQFESPEYCSIALIRMAKRGRCFLHFSGSSLVRGTKPTLTFHLQFCLQMSRGIALFGARV